jgi:cell division protein FtsW
MTTRASRILREELPRRVNASGTQPCDRFVIFLVGMLMTLGVVMVYSASVTVRGAEFDWQRWWATPLRQCVFAMAGFLAMLFVAHLDYRLIAWERPRDWWCSGLLFVLAAGLLVAMLIPGLGVHRLGAQRSLAIYSGAFTLSFQPAELAKIVMVIWLAALLSRPRGDIKDLRRGFLPALLTAGLLIALTSVEDFGTGALMGVIMLGMFLLAGARWLHLIGTGLLGAVAGVALILIEPYRLRRILIWLTEEPDPTGEGYQITQSLIAIGSGGWWGRGLGAGVQKYGYLPQDNNDFILAILCEELGVVGGLAVVALFLLLLWRGWRISASAPDSFGKLLAAGITLTICLQAAFNIGVVTNSVPTKGISLPFVSAGGSGVLFLGLAAGLLASVGRSAARVPIRSAG